MVRGPKWNWLVSDYVTWRPATAKCQMCTRQWDVDLSRFPLSTRLVDLEPRLVCTACGSRKVNYFIRPTLGFALKLSSTGSEL